MDVEEFEDDPRIQAMRDAARERSKNHTKMVLAAILIGAAIVLFLWATHSMKPVEVRDPVSYGKLHGRVFEVKPTITAVKGGGVAYKLEVGVVIYALKEELTEPNVKALAERTVERASGKTYDFPMASGGSEKQKPTTITVNCYLYPSERVHVNLPTIVKRVPVVEGQPLLPAQLVWRTNGNSEWQFGPQVPPDAIPPK